MIRRPTVTCHGKKRLQHYARGTWQTKGGKPPRTRRKEKNMAQQNNRAAYTPKRQRDWCTQTGAEDLALAIQEHWAARGHKVTTRVIAVITSEQATRSIYGVRSSLIDGLPPDDG